MFINIKQIKSVKLPNFGENHPFPARCSANGDNLSKFSISVTPQAPHGDGGVMFSFGLNQFSNLCSPLTALPRLRMTTEARRTRLLPGGPVILTQALRVISYD